MRYYIYYINECYLRGLCKDWGLLPLNFICMYAREELGVRPFCNFAIDDVANALNLSYVCMYYMYLPHLFAFYFIYLFVSGSVGSYDGFTVCVSRWFIWGIDSFLLVLYCFIFTACMHILYLCVCMMPYKIWLSTRGDGLLNLYVGWINNHWTVFVTSVCL